MPADPDIQAAAQVVIAGEKEYSRQLWRGVAEPDLLRPLMTERFVGAVVDYIRATTAGKRRFAPGDVNDFVVLRIERGAKPDLAHVIVCSRNNDAEYDTRGTVSASDDVLIQARLTTSGRRVQVVREVGGWRIDAQEPEEGTCQGVFP